ncbi:MAG TPA: NrpR regulatory domain-containing protein [Candidatus Hydrogenedentes bacterium]|jgi:repressor of nif and glnA expression|nr:MAG: Ribonuclease R winged-helix domain protein [Candidatus Hydrogenedentes bacterium ADurb.Bin101]HOC69776.1 NrpR regulatory domain-containing protein [Candidatus Hydrogenedentota bacterium]HQM99727.1 NrpR regulatory domain-containing protein [Candidatus Hydrogenedentota bacterium]
MDISSLDIKTRRRAVAILRLVGQAESGLGSERIARDLAMAGIRISERAVRNYLIQTDALGWTVNLGRRGRRLTDEGRAELDRALVVDKVGFIAAKVDTLSYQMSFDLETRRGMIILNISTVDAREFGAAMRVMGKVYQSRLGMGKLVAVAESGARLGRFSVPQGKVAVGTVCSVSLNGILLRANITTTSRFGGLLELENTQPTRFTEIINYDGSSLDPLEIFIRSGMTSVLRAAKSGSGVLGASFREVPAVALPEVKRLIKKTEALGLGGVIALGSPDQPLLDIPVTVGRAGMIVRGGLNPIAAVVESGISVTSAAMSDMCEFERLADYRNFL